MQIQSNKMRKINGNRKPFQYFYTVEWQSIEVVQLDVNCKASKIVVNVRRTACDDGGGSIRQHESKIYSEKKRRVVNDYGCGTHVKWPLP